MNGKMDHGAEKLQKFHQSDPIKRIIRFARNFKHQIEIIFDYQIFSISDLQIERGAFLKFNMENRKGDTVEINGNYQFRALTRGHPVQRFWHYSKQLAIRRFLPPTSTDYIIDAGCGSGVVTSFIGGFGATVLGIDSNPKAIEFAKAVFSSPNIEFRLGLVDDKIQLNRFVDKIYCLEVIEHIYIHQAKDMLGVFLDILKPGGKLFLTTPNYRSLWPIIEYFMDRLGMSPSLYEHQHIHPYTKKRLETLCREVGFGIDYVTATCFIAPWLASISWNLALKIDSIESKLPFCIGSILVFVLAKPK